MAQNCPLHGVEMKVIGTYGASEYDRCPICGMIYLVYSTMMMNAPLPMNAQNIQEIKVNSDGKLEITYREE
jgi:Zn-finger nucleic acid-binding protein